MLKKMRALVLLMLLLLLVPGVYGYDNSKSGVFVSLVPGIAYNGTLQVNPDGSSYQTFTISVPEDAFGLRVFVEESEADIDLYLLYGKEISSYKEADYGSSKDDWNEEITVSRFSDPPLRTGTYYLDVAYLLSETPVINGKRLSEISFTLYIEIIIPKVQRRLTPGLPAAVNLLPQDLMFTIVEVEIPDNRDAFRIDTYNSSLDIDFFVSRERPAVSGSEAQYSAVSLLGREHIVLGPDSLYPPEPGTYYISIFDQTPGNFAEEVSVIVTLDKNAPKEVTDIPSFPFLRDSMENALFSTVEIIGDTGKGSGCLVSPAGHILTNYHVIRDRRGNPSDMIAVAVNTSPFIPPVELFLAQPVFLDRDRDLALLKITGGLYGQPLPFRYRFPFFRLGNPAELVIGQPLGFIGYPAIGGTGSRVTVTYSQGVVSGFQRNPVISLIKTDGVFHDGSSGGAALNSYGELIGIPTVIVGDGSGQIGFVSSLDMLPAEWISAINTAR